MGLSGLGLRGEGGSAVWTKRREGAPGYVREGGGIQVKCGDGSLLPY